MSYQFPPDLEAYVEQKIASGRFASREEFAVEAVRVFRDLEAKHAELKNDVQAAMDEAARGLSEPLDIEAIQAELFAELDERGQAK